MNTREEIISYIKQKEQNGALLVTGPWGCGKTYLIKEIENEFNKEKDFYICVLSLFGISSTNELEHSIKEKIFNSVTSAKDTENDSKKVKKIAEELTSAIKEFSPVFKALNTFVSMDFYDFIDVERYVKHNKNKKELVLIFDDLERSNIDVITLLGFINNYCENLKIKTIIIADESKLKESKYEEFKEKVILQTLHVSLNYEDIIDGIINDYNETQTGYNDFLKNGAMSLKKAFFESECKNLRSAKSAVIMFERAFHILDDLDVDTDYKNKIFYNFSAYIFEGKMGNCQRNDGEKYLYINPNNSKKYSDINPYIIPEELREWAVESKWNSVEIKEYYKRIFCTPQTPVFEKFLSLDFWGLTEDIIKSGLPIAVEKAYSGELSCEQLTELLQRVHFLDDYNIKHIKIDYSKVLEGLKNRILLIKSGEIIEPSNGRFIDKIDGYDLIAQDIYKLIKQFEDKQYQYKARLDLIYYLGNFDSKPKYSFKNADIGPFDDEVRNAFLTAYKSLPLKRSELTWLLDGLNLFETGNSIIKEDETTTINSLKILVEELKIMAESETDCIAQIIIKRTINKIEEKIKEVTLNQ